jgi:predicted secreted protein
MTTATDKLQARQLAEVAQAALDERQPSGYRIHAVSDGIRQEDDWFYIPVRSDEDRRSREFYFALSEAESVIEDQHGLHVLLVPAIIED